MNSIKWDYKIGSLLGIPFYINLSFFAGIAYFSVVLSDRYSGPGQLPLLWGFISFLVLFTGVTLHELGHCYASQTVGLQPYSITLYLFGGVARLKGLGERPRDALWIALAGPLVSLLLAILGGLLLLTDVSGNLRVLCADIALINFGVLLFNLLPIAPLDGGRALTSLVWSFFSRSGRVSKYGYVRAVTFVSAFISLPLLLTALLLLIFAGGSSGIWLILMGLYILNGLLSEFRMAAFLERFGEKTAGKGMLSVKKVSPEDKVIDVFDSSYQDSVSFVFTEDAGGHRRLYSNPAIFKDLFRSEAASFTTETRVMDLPEERITGQTHPSAIILDLLYKELDGSGAPIWIVVDNGEWLGVLLPRSEKHLGK